MGVGGSHGIPENVRTRLRNHFSSLALQQHNIVQAHFGKLAKFRARSMNITHAAFCVGRGSQPNLVPRPLWIKSGRAEAWVRG